MESVIKNINFYSNPEECGYVAVIETVDGKYWVDTSGVIQKPIPDSPFIE